MRLSLNIPGQRQPLGEILVREGYVTQDDIDYALQEQRMASPGERLGTILLRLGRITPNDFARALGRQLTTLQYFSRRIGISSSES